MSEVTSQKELQEKINDAIDGIDVLCLMPGSKPTHEDFQAIKETLVGFKTAKGRNERRLLQMVLCECNSFDCKEFIIMEHADYDDCLVHISNSCKVGPDPTDILFEKRDGYVVYTEG